MLGRSSILLRFIQCSYGEWAVSVALGRKFLLRKGAFAVTRPFGLPPWYFGCTESGIVPEAQYPLRLLG